MLTPLKALRLRKNLTQQDLAEQLGVSREIVSKWERGLHGVKYEIIQQMGSIYETGGEAVAAACYRTWIDRHTR